MVFKVKDFYFKKAKQENYLARSIYKLEEIDKKYQILRPRDTIMDFGYFPGSWVQYAAKKVGSHGLVVGVDIQEVNESLIGIPNIRLYQKNAEEVEELSQLGVIQPFDVVLSDMAPKTTGIRLVDQQMSLRLVEKIFDLLPLFLKKNGHVVVKVFEGGDAQNYLKSQKKFFNEMHYLRPKSTRSCSKEFFVIAKGYRPPQEER